MAPKTNRHRTWALASHLLHPSVCLELQKYLGHLSQWTFLAVWNMFWLFAGSEMISGDEQTLNNGPVNHPSLKERSLHFNVTLMVLWLYQLLFSRHFHITVEKPSSVPFVLYQRWISSYMFTYLYRRPWNFQQNSSPLLKGWGRGCGSTQRPKARLGDFVWALALGKSHVHKKPWLIHISYTWRIDFCWPEKPHLISRTNNKHRVLPACGAHF